MLGPTSRGADVYISDVRSGWAPRIEWPLLLGDADGSGSSAEVDTAMLAYDRQLRALPNLRERLQALRGKTIGCWCQCPETCHGVVLRRFAINM